jgi:hypothetical protein
MENIRISSEVREWRKLHSERSEIKEYEVGGACGTPYAGGGKKKYI